MNVGPIGQMDSYSYNYKGYSSNVRVKPTLRIVKITIKSIMTIKVISEIQILNDRCQKSLKI